MMDPSETLRRLRDAIEGYDVDQDDAREAFKALDEWLSKGGALPDDWQRRDPEPTRVPVDPFA